MESSRTASKDVAGKPLKATDCISVDISQFVDLPQPDSGSNQSGSDSGLGGCTNSLSSDSSSYNNGAALVATNTTNTGQITKDQSNTYNNRNKVTNNNNNNGIGENDNNKPNDYGLLVTAAAASSSSSSCLPSAATKKQNEVETVDEESRCELNEGDRSVTPTRQAPLKPIQQQHTKRHHQQRHDDTNDYEVLGQQTSSHQNTLVQAPSASSSSPSSLSPPSTSSVPVLKSLLKKPSHFSNEPARAKHTRKVSFNQTVIVFCEEIRTHATNEQFEPPLDYRDSAEVAIFEPPLEYCDTKVVPECGRGSPLVNDYHTNSHDETDGEGFHAKAINIEDNLDVTSKLTHDQLINLLEDESLLETFKLNYDHFSEDDFPVNHLNSNHSYLCDDAISDYDSDSESSLYIESRKGNVDDKAVSLKPGRILNSLDHDKVEPDLDELNLKLYHKTKSDDKTSAQTAQVQPTDNRSKTVVSRSKPHKSMPARMKVSTVDNSQTKKQVNRHEGHDIKLKNDINTPRGLNQSLTSNDDATSTRPAPLTIKQTTVEPIPISKPVILTNNFSNSQPSTLSSHNNTVTLPRSELNGPTKTISNDNQDKQSHKSQQPTIMPTSEASPSIYQNCQMCRYIESSKSVNPEVDRSTCNKVVHNIRSENDRQIIQNTQQANQAMVKLPNQPTALNQNSCISCHEASVQNGLPLSRQLKYPTTSTAQPMRPVAYQLVYVVDSKGNRVRALSLVRPVVRYSDTSVNQGNVNGRRVLVNQQGIRFPNPLSMYGGQIVNGMVGQQMPIRSNRDQSVRMIGSTTQQYRLMAASNQMQQTFQVSSQNNYAQNPGPTCTSANAQRTNNLLSNRGPVAMEGPHQHTVYYVRKPLEAHTMCRQSTDGHRGLYFKSFPDPHEIRRLDGLRSPLVSTNSPNINTGAQNAQLCNQNEMDRNLRQQFHSTNSAIQSQPRQSNAHRLDDADDPTFGFSKRPSVKVVATTSNHPSFSPLDARHDTNQLNRTNLTSKAVLQPTSNNTVTLQRTVNQNDKLRPDSLVIMRSQTLDRAHLNQQSQQQQQHMKENMPTTNSMSNIHGTYTNHPTSNDKVSIINPSQQSRISGTQQNLGPTTNTEGLNTKETLDWNGSNKPRSICNKEVISINKVEPATGPQKSQSYGLGGDSAQNPQRRNQDQSEVAYSMNI